MTKVKNLFLSAKCKEVILGSLLGDGSLRIPGHYQNARFSFKHSELQKDYFFWKADQLKEISSDSHWWLQKKDGLGGNKLRYQSLALKSLTEIYHLTHQKDTLKINREWLGLLTPRSLAVWWLDDGSLIGVGARRGVICTDPFPLKDQRLMADYLREKWGIKVKIGKTKRIWKGNTRTFYRLWIRSGEELRKLLRIILPHIEVAAMLPKVLLLYKDSELQQRWISEVSFLTGFSEGIVKKYLKEKKKKWKDFRE